MDADAIVAEIDACAADALAAIEAAGTEADLDAAKKLAFGRTSRLTEIKKQMPTLDADTKPAVGKALGAANARIGAAADARAGILAEAAEAHMLAAERLDLTVPGRRGRHGHRHPISQVIDEFCDVMLAMGYRIAEGPEVETDWYNFEALNIPATHPARSMWDTLYVDTGAGADGETLLRTHTSPVQIRVMESTPPPLYYLMPGRTFRRDTLDATHSPVFHQIEGLAIDRDLTFGDMAGTIERVCHEYFGPSFDIRLHPDFFPFTEPSAGLEVWWGDRWLEIAGCGMVDPNVLRAVGLDPDEWQGFAFGFGVERIAMLRYGIDDIRVFLENDVRVLEQFT